MNKEQALQEFWSGFDIPAYDENSVPDNATLPYITYTVAVDGFDRPVSLQAAIWYKDTSWEAITNKAEEIAQTIGRGGVMKSYMNGCVWLKMGTPFEQRIPTLDDMIKRITINIEAEFIG